jgi:hypothetical protein
MKKNSTATQENRVVFIHEVEKDVRIKNRYKLSKLALEETYSGFTRTSTLSIYNFRLLTKPFLIPVNSPP